VRENFSRYSNCALVVLHVNAFEICKLTFFE